MKKLLGAGLLVLPFLLMPSHAQAWCLCGWPYQIDAGANVYFRVNAQPTAQCGPWYLYWPLEAHFGPPAPTGFPYWPPKMALPPAPASHAAPAPLALPPNQATPLAPAGYYGYPR